MQNTNHLINESSPYLLQHAHNPVHWYPWGETALKMAQAQNKPLIISIGYAACHWCHVMEKESFENSEIAELMNNHFICIKVDREERPDIDQIYMHAVQLLTGSGGWPLNCFALPNGQPFYGGTYYQPAHWEHILQSLANMYALENEKIVDAASNLTYHLQLPELNTKAPDNEELKKEILNEIIEKWKPQFDKIEGGNNYAPKFPMPNSLDFLLSYGNQFGDQEVLHHAENTLDKMAGGGIYDQAGGGFARYSVDKYWKVPHFEKMLYDNAQLISLYSNAYRIFKKEYYKRIVYQSIEFIERELSSSEGNLFSSLDADSEGHEGLYYIWEKTEIDKILGSDSELYCEYFQISEKGNWENKKNILHHNNNFEYFTQKFQITEDELFIKIENLNKLLLTERNKRIKPACDDKILTSWNALMIKAYIDAYKALNNTRFLEKALQSADFISNKMTDENFKLLRNYKNGKSSINGFLDDYAFTIEAFILLYQVTFDEKWINKAKSYTDYCIKHFFNDETKMFYYTSDVDDKLIARKMEISDNVIPSSNSTMAKNLQYLGYYYLNEEYQKFSRLMLNNVLDQVKSNGNYYSNWALLLLSLIFEPIEITICGPDALKYLHGFKNQMTKNQLIAGSMFNSGLPVMKDKPFSQDTLIYICYKKVCYHPVKTSEEAINLIKSIT